MIVGGPFYSYDMTTEADVPSNSPADAAAQSSALQSAAFDGYVDSELDPDFWDRELELLNQLYADDDIDSSYMYESEAESASRHVNFPAVADDSLPLTTELLAQTEAAFLESVRQSVATLSSNLSRNHLPPVGDTVFDPNDERPYTAADRVRHITERLVTIEQAERALAAARTSLLAEIPDSYIADSEQSNEECVDPHGMGVLSAANLVAVKTQTSDKTVKSHISYAYQLAKSLPEVVTELQRGHISFAHAIEIARASANLPDKDLIRYAEEALNIARSSSPGRLRRRLPKLVASLSPQSVQELTKRAYTERRVWVSESDDGMAIFGAILPAPLALAAYDRVTRIAKQTMREMPAQAPGDPQHDDGITSHVKDERSLDQARADVCAELLLASAAQRTDKHTGGPLGLGIDAKIHVTVPVTAFHRTYDTDNTGNANNANSTGDTGCTGNGKTTDNSEYAHTTGTDSTENVAPSFAELHGYGIIDPEIARLFATDAKSWDRVFIGPGNSIIATDNYEPSAAMRRQILARDQHCRFPGCLAPPTQCEIDHTHDWAKGGRTTTRNLALLCKRHHALKHPSVHETARWKVEQLPGGVMEWKSPDGQVFKDLPDPPSGSAHPLVAPKVKTKRVVRFRIVDPDCADDQQDESQRPIAHMKLEKYFEVMEVAPLRDPSNTRPWAAENGPEQEWDPAQARPF